MDKVLAALLGTFIGFLLPTIAGMIKSRTTGKRFGNAVRNEISQAADRIHQKMVWLSRDITTERTGKNEKLIVEYEGRHLFLGEPETFEIALNFWQANIRDIAEIMDTKNFNKICEKVTLVLKFEAKFMDMKNAFNFSEQTSKEIALVCYKELIDIHNDLCTDKKM